MRFEGKLILYACLFLVIILPIGTITNYFFRINQINIVFTAVSSVIFLILYFKARKSCCFKKIRLIISVYLFILLNVGWFANYGSLGPVLTTYIVFVSFLVFVWERKYYLIIFAIIVLNIAVLLISEIGGFIPLGNYSSITSRVFDVYLGIFIAAILIFVFSYLAKESYREQYEMAKRSDELKTAFIANLSHELRTPLNAIIGFSGLLSDANIKSKRLEYAGLVASNGEHLIRLIDDIMDISLIESNQLLIRPEKVHLIDFLNSMITMTENEKKRYDNRKLKIVSDHNVENPIIIADNLRLKQILFNLITNAVKFTERGEILINITEEAKSYTFTVKDTGIGIKEENFKDIFKRFHKIEPSKKFLYRGNGIGLYLCKQIAERLGGQIGFESIYGIGSTFWLTIPKLSKQK